MGGRDLGMASLPSQGHTLTEGPFIFTSQGSAGDQAWVGRENSPLGALSSLFVLPSLHAARSGFAAGGAEGMGGPRQDSDLKDGRQEVSVTGESWSQRGLSENETLATIQDQLGSLTPFCFAAHGHDAAPLPASRPF